MTTAQTQYESPGENVASSVDGTPPAASFIDDLRLAAASNELQQLREDLAARDQMIADMQRSITHLESQLVAPSPTARSRLRGALSAALADDQSARTQRLDHAAIHASATGKRRDLLEFLRLRRRKQ